MINNRVIDSYAKKQEKLASLAEELRYASRVLLINLQFKNYVSEKELQDAANKLQELCDAVNRVHRESWKGE